MSGNTLKYMINKVSGDIGKKASQPNFARTIAGIGIEQYDYDNKERMNTAENKLLNRYKIDLKQLFVRPKEWYGLISEGAIYLILDAFSIYYRTLVLMNLRKIVLLKI